MSRLSFPRIDSIPIPAVLKWNLRQHALSWLRQIQKYRRNAKTRKQLADLPLHLRRDIGLTDEQIRHEVDKKFWE